MIIQAPINTLGYGYTGYNLTKQLAKLSNVSLYPIGQPDRSFTDIEQYIWTEKPHKVNDIEIKIWHQHELTTWITKGRRIGFPIFELTHFTKQEVESLKHCDHLFVPSKWAQNIIRDHIEIPVSVIPLGVDNLIFNDLNNINRKETIFFNCGKWEIRKGHDILIECFNRAFAPQDNVELWLMCHNPFIDNSRWDNLVKNSKLAHKIKLISRQPTQKNVYNIMRQVDCGVFPARAEGWNLELLEVMACGKPVITTNYSAHTEFCNKENANLIEIESFELASDNIWFHGQGLWAQITERQKEQLVDYMKNIHKLKQSAGFLKNDKGTETARHFTWENSAKTIIKNIGD